MPNEKAQARKWYFKSRRYPPSNQQNGSWQVPASQTDPLIHMWSQQMQSLQQSQNQLQQIMYRLPMGHIPQYNSFQGSISPNTFLLTNFDLVAGTPSFTSQPGPLFYPQTQPAPSSYHSQSSPSPIKDDPKAGIPSTISQQGPLFYPQTQPDPSSYHSQSSPSPIKDDPKAGIAPTTSQQGPLFYPQTQPAPSSYHSQSSPSPIKDDPKAGIAPTTSQQAPPSYYQAQPEHPLRQSQSSPSPIKDDPKTGIPLTTPQPEHPLRQSQSSPSPIKDDPKAGITLTTLQQGPLSYYQAQLEHPLRQSQSSPSPIKDDPKAHIPSNDSKRRASNENFPEISLKRAKQGAGEDFNDQADMELIVSTECKDHDPKTVAEEAVQSILAPRYPFRSLPRGLNEKIKSAINVIENGVISIGPNEVPICTGDIQIFKDRDWYSWQTFNILRASMRLKPGWLIVLPQEGLGQSMPTSNTTDIAWIMHENERNHWTTVHLSITQWKMVYYDSYLHKGSMSNKDKSCDVALKDVRERYSVGKLQLPVEDPDRDAACSIPQYDHWSCGPLAWREIETLIHGPLDDGERPLAIRSHQLDLVHSKLLGYSDEGSPASVASIDSISLEGNFNINDSSGKPCSEIADNLDIYNAPSLETGAQLPLKVPAPHVKNSFWTPAQLSYIRESLKEHKSTGAIAKALSCTPRSVQYTIDYRRLRGGVLQEEEDGDCNDEASAEGREPNTHTYYLDHLVPAPHRKWSRWTTEQVEFLLKCRRAGVPKETIAEKLGCKSSTVYHYMERNGLATYNTVNLGKRDDEGDDEGDNEGDDEGDDDSDDEETLYAVDVDPVASKKRRRNASTLSKRKIEFLAQAALQGKPLRSVANRLEISYMDCYNKAYAMELPHIWDRPFGNTSAARVKRALSQAGITSWPGLASRMRQSIVRLKAFMAQEKIDAGILKDNNAYRSRDRLQYPKSVVRLPAVDRFVVPVCSDQIFALDICERRIHNGQCKLIPASWKCIRSAKGIVAVDQARSLVSLAAVVQYLDWDYFTLQQWSTSRDDKMLHDAQLYWRKQSSFLSLSDGNPSPEKLFRLGFWLPMRSAFRLFVSTGFWEDAFENLFGQDAISSHTIKPILDDCSQSVCPTCLQTYDTTLRYYMHAMFHLEGLQRLCPLCYQGKTTRGGLCKHRCFSKEAGVSAYHISFSGLNEVSTILQSLQDPLRVPKTTRQYHVWTSVFGSVRFSNQFEVKKGIAVQEWLREEYRKAFSPTTARWGIVKCSSAKGRSSTSPIFCYGGSPEVLIHDDKSSLPREGRILLLIHGIEGLTTNLQSLVTMEKELSGLEVHLGFRLRPRINEPNMDQERIHGIQWTFYSLSPLVNMLLGRVETSPEYERLIHSWFIVQCGKVGRWQTRSNSPTNRAMKTAMELGGGSGRNMMTGPEAAMSFQGPETDWEESEVDTEDE